MQMARAGASGPADLADLLASLDSYAGRVTWNPNAHWSVATGYGYLADPEPAHPGESIHRATASLQHATSTGTSGQGATTVI